MTSRSNSREPRNPRDFNDPRNRPQDRSEGTQRTDRGDRPARPRFDQTDRPERGERSERPAWAVRGERGDRPDRSRFNTPRAPREQNDGDRPRQPRGTGIVAELKELDHDLIRLITRRSRMLTRLPATGASEIERELRTSWETAASAISRDPRLIRQLFALLQEVEVAPAALEQPAAFNLAPSRKPVTADLSAPPSDRLPRLNMVLAASSGTVCELHGVSLNAPVMECLKGLNQVGARLRWEDDGRILCQGEDPISGYNKPILDRVVHVGEDAFNLYLILFQMVTRPARLKIIGESGLKFVNLAPLRHFLPLLGARFTSVIPGQEGLPARLESSAMLPSEVTIPADLEPEAVEAMLMATPGWEREVTVHLEAHPEGHTVAARVMEVFRASGVQAALTDSDGKLALHVVPGKTKPDTTAAGVHFAGAVSLLATPAFVGGTMRLRGHWAELGETRCHQAEELLRSAGLTVTVDAEGITSSLILPEGSPEGNTSNVVQALPDLSHLPQSLLPLGVALSLIKANDGVMPRLPEGTDLALVDSFLAQLGFQREGEKLTKTTPSAAPWASPSLTWALALSLAAFLRPNLKLSNPGIVLNSLPTYWNIYNSLPSPTPIRRQEEETPAAATSSTKPARRRVIASHTPESEMPDEIVYPDED